MSKAATTVNVPELLQAVRTDLAAGETIIEKARADFGIDHALDDDHQKIPLPSLPYWKQNDLVINATSSAINEMLTNLIEYIVNAERAGRLKVAGVGLARLREHYEGFDTKDLPADEQSWQAFAAKHLPLPPERVTELIGLMVHRGAVLRCTKCGISSKCQCGCGAPYVGDHRFAMRTEPKAKTALDRAIAAVTADPEKSNRTIAAEIGVTERTVRRARQQTKISDDDAAPDAAPDRRVGRDGRSYPVARKDDDSHGT
jgi:hypothetical protein